MGRAVAICGSLPLCSKGPLCAHTDPWAVGCGWQPGPARGSPGWGQGDAESRLLGGTAPPALRSEAGVGVPEEASWERGKGVWSGAQESFAKSSPSRQRVGLGRLLEKDRQSGDQEQVTPAQHAHPALRTLGQKSCSQGIQDYHQKMDRDGTVRKLPISIADAVTR